MVDGETQMHEVCDWSLEDDGKQQIDSKWPWLNNELMRDIFNTHKIFMFGAFNCTLYTLSNFRDNVAKAEKDILGNPGYSKRLRPRKFRDNATLFPTFLIDDDIFQVFAWFFGVSQWINDILIPEMNAQSVRQNIFCFVIPDRTVSLYDDNVVYDDRLTDIEVWIKSEMPNVVYCKTFANYNHTSNDVMDRIIEMEETFERNKGSSGNLVILIDRRGCRQNGIASIFIIQDLAQKMWKELITNHFIGIHFSFGNNAQQNENILVRSWLHYGKNQRLRFWPEQLIWFVPRVFTKQVRNESEFAKRLYADCYKHGFCTNLDDPIFSKYYKILTGWSHQSVNYRRSKGTKRQRHHFGFRDYAEVKLRFSLTKKLSAFWIQNDYSTDDILDDIYDSVLGDDSNIANIFEKHEKD